MSGLGQKKVNIVFAFQKRLSMQPIHLPSEELKIIQGSSSRQQIIVTRYTAWFRVSLH